MEATYVWSRGLHSRCPLLLLALEAATWIVPILIGRRLLWKLPAVRFAAVWIGFGMVFFFPLAIGCGPMGCSTISPCTLLRAALFGW